MNYEKFQNLTRKTETEIQYTHTSWNSRTSLIQTFHIQEPCSTRHVAGNGALFFFLHVVAKKCSNKRQTALLQYLHFYNITTVPPHVCEEVVWYCCKTLEGIFQAEGNHVLPQRIRTYLFFFFVFCFFCLFVHCILHHAHWSWLTFIFTMWIILHYLSYGLMRCEHPLVPRCPGKRSSAAVTKHIHV